MVQTVIRSTGRTMVMTVEVNTTKRRDICLGPSIIKNTTDVFVIENTKMERVSPLCKTLLMRAALRHEPETTLGSLANPVG